MLSARVGLVLLWLSQVAHVGAVACLGLFVVLELDPASPATGLPPLFLAAALWLGPFVLLARVVGHTADTWPRNRVVSGAAAFCLAALLVYALAGWPRLWCLAVTAFGSAVLRAAYLAQLPAAARDCRLTLPRLTGWVETAVGLGVVVGLGVGLAGMDEAWRGIPRPMWYSLALQAIAALAALPVHFPADQTETASAGQSPFRFFRDAARILRDRQGRHRLLGLAATVALIPVGIGAVLVHALGPDVPLQDPVLLYRVVMAGLGLAVGSGLGGLQGHAYRTWSLVPFGGIVGLVLLVWVAGWPAADGPCFLLGIVGGLALVPMRAGLLAALPDDARGNGIALSGLANAVAVAALALLLFGLLRGGAGSFTVLAVVAVLVAAGTFGAWVVFYRACVEQVMEFVIWPMFRISAHGPGPAAFPPRGPVLLVANHAAWVDPLVLAKVAPRRITAMMTSLFYDKPGLHWLVKYVCRAIRVESSYYRREAPELKEGIAALDRGECVLIFPEGMMRRRDDTPIRLFGQGIWHMLRARPETPLVPCWIEGTWGSYTSYRGGPPTVNKKLDRWRPIDIALGEPLAVAPEVLADLRATRRFLMQACLDMRQHLGLESAALPAHIKGEAEAEDDEKEETAE